MSKSIASRIAKAEQRLTSARPVISEIFIKGAGVDAGIRAQIIGGPSFEGEAGEKLEALRIRIRAIVGDQRAALVVYGGLPPPPTEFAVPPGMMEALTRVGWAGVDEIDAGFDQGDGDQPE